jgi:hypothetical protein
MCRKAHKLIAGKRKEKENDIMTEGTPKSTNREAAPQRWLDRNRQRKNFHI